MKNQIKLLLSGCLIGVVIMFSSCRKDEDKPNNKQPGINVGDDIVGMTGMTYPINITASDPDGDALEYTWTIIESPAGSSPTLTNTSNNNANFSTNIAGLYRVEIGVNDGVGGTASGIVKLYIGGVLPSSINANTTLPDLFDDEQYPEYYARNSIQVTAGLTLAPGVVVEMGPDVRLWFNGNASFINAEGTPAKNIILRGVQKTKGSWRVIEITSSNLNNKFNHVQILHAGSSATGGQRTAVLVKSNVSGRLGIKNTTISMSGGYGIFIDGNAGAFTEFTDNTFSNNDAAPMRIGAGGLLTIDNNSVYTGNAIQAIEVASGANITFENNGTIKKISVPYHFFRSGQLMSTVTFEPGVTCLFNSGLRLWVTSTGAIVADGTATDKITFSSLTEAPGAWSGIELASNSVFNKINHAIVSNGGSSSGRGANIFMFGSSPGSQLILTNSEVKNSQTYGLRSTSGSVNLTESNNTFSNNPSGDIRQD